MEVPKRAKNLMGLVTGLVNKIKTMHFKSQCNFTGHLSIYISIIQSRLSNVSVSVGILFKWKEFTYKLEKKKKKHSNVSVNDLSWLQCMQYQKLDYIQLQFHSEWYSPVTSKLH